MTVILAERHMQTVIYLNIEYVGRTKLKGSTNLWDFKCVYVFAEGGESATVIDANSISEVAKNIAYRLGVNIDDIIIESPTLAYYHNLCGTYTVDDIKHWQNLITIANNQIERIKSRD